MVGSKWLAHRRRRWDWFIIHRWIEWTIDNIFDWHWLSKYDFLLSTSDLTLNVDYDIQNVCYSERRKGARASERERERMRQMKKKNEKRHSNGRMVIVLVEDETNKIHWLSRGSFFFFFFVASRISLFEKETNCTRARACACVYFNQLIDCIEIPRNQSVFLAIVSFFCYGNESKCLLWHCRRTYSLVNHFQWANFASFSLSLSLLLTCHFIWRIRIFICICVRVCVCSFTYPHT